jgi:hypothetical protein
MQYMRTERELRKGSEMPEDSRNMSDMMEECGTNIFSKKPSTRSDDSSRKGTGQGEQTRTTWHMGVGM